MNTAAIAVAYSSDDVAHLTRQGISCQGILALSPNAMLSANRAGLAVEDGTTRYTDFRQARTVIKRDRRRSVWLHRQGAASPVDNPIAYALDFTYVVLFHGYDRAHACLGDSGPWLVRNGDAWTLHDERAAAARATARHILSHYAKFLGTYDLQPPKLPRLFRVLQSCLIPLIRKPAASFSAGRSDHPLGYEKALLSNPGTQQWYFAPAGAGNLEYARLLREVWRSLRGVSMLQFRVAPDIDTTDRNEARRRIDLHPDADFRVLAADFLPIITDLCAMSAGLAREYTRLLRKLKPDALLCSEVADLNMAALFIACDSIGIPTIVGSHNSFAPVSGRLSQQALKHQFLHQHAHGKASRLLIRWPPTLEAARQIDDSLAARGEAVISDRLPAPSERPAGDPFRILHASNGQRFFSSSAWIYETVGETADAAIALVQHGLKIPDTEYIIRTKFRRHELSEAAFAELLPVSPRVTLKFRHSNPFSEDLEAADLVVAFRSTTILQALYARKPVLLWGVSNRYRDMQGREAPPSIGDRAAVYSVRNSDDLPEMIAAIRTAHATHSLTDAELAPYLWPAGTPTSATWAAQWLKSASG